MSTTGDNTATGFAGLRSLRSGASSLLLGGRRAGNRRGPPRGYLARTFRRAHSHESQYPASAQTVGVSSTLPRRTPECCPHSWE